MACGVGHDSDSFEACHRTKPSSEITSHGKESKSLPNIRHFMRNRNNQQLRGKENRNSVCSQTVKHAVKVNLRHDTGKHGLRSCSKPRTTQYPSHKMKSDNPNKNSTFSQDMGNTVSFFNGNCVIGRRKEPHKNHRLCKSFNSDVSDEQEPTDSSTSSGTWGILDKNGRQTYRRSMPPCFRSHSTVHYNGTFVRRNNGICIDLPSGLFWKKERLKSSLSKKKIRKEVNYDLLKLR